MSWVHEHQERWDQLEVSAVARWLVRLYEGQWGGCVNDEGVIVYRISGVLFDDEPEVFRAILDKGADKLIDESEYFDGLVP